MARRIAIGPFPGGFDARISRPGFDARTADVNDPTKISFAMSRGLEQRGEVGKIMQTNTWVDFATTYSEPPFIMFFYREGGMFVQGEWQLTRFNNGRVNYETTSSGFNLLIETTRVMAFRPFDGATVGCDLTYVILGTSQ